MRLLTQIFNSTEALSLIIDSEFDEYAKPPVKWHEIQPYMPTVERNENNASEIVSRVDNSGAKNITTVYTK